MSDPTQESEPGARNDVSPPGMPRWVKASLLVVAAFVLIFVILKFTGVGGEHGPGRHQATAPAVSADADPAQLGPVSNTSL